MHLTGTLYAANSTAGLEQMLSEYARTMLAHFLMR
jgi:hypothetical protein